MDAARAQELLTRERARIEAKLAGLGAASESTEEGTDPAAEAPAVVQANLDEAVGETLRGQLAAITRAEQRLADGTYGRSIDSGEPIPDGRLEAVPWAERTAEEQSRLDGAGA